MFFDSKAWLRANSSTGKQVLEFFLPFTLYTYFFPLRCKESVQLFGKATTCIASTSEATIKPGALPWARYYAPSGFLVPNSQGSSFQTYSAPSGLVKIVRSIQGTAPLAIYYAPSGLKTSDKFWNLKSEIRKQ